MSLRSIFQKFRLVARRLAALSFIYLILLGFSQPAQAIDDLSGICELAAAEASAREGVPLSVMRAIALGESGRHRDGELKPWPWTVNMEGKGFWFDSRAEALAFAQKEYDKGARSFDIGCFQINFRWHGQHFSSIDHMFEPLANAVYAARFMRSLYAEQGSWEAAAGAYHSRTPEFANSYAERFSNLRNTLQPHSGQNPPDIPDIVLAAYGAEGPPPLAGADDVARINSYPLLQTGSGGGLGSLVPIGNAAGVMLFGAPASTGTGE